MRILSPAEFPLLDAQQTLAQRLYEIPPSMTNLHDRHRLVRLVHHSLPHPCPLWHIEARQFRPSAGNAAWSPLAGLQLPGQAMLRVVVDGPDAHELGLGGDDPQGWRRLRQALEALPVRLVLLDIRVGPFVGRGTWYESTLKVLARHTFEGLFCDGSFIDASLEPREVPWSEVEAVSSNVLDFYDVCDDMLQRRCRAPHLSWNEALEASVMASLRQAMAEVPLPAAWFLLELANREAGPELPDPTVGRQQGQVLVEELLRAGLLERSGSTEEGQVSYPPRMSYVLDKPNLLSILRQDRGPGENPRIASSLEPVLVPLLAEDDSVPIQSLGDLRRRVDALRGAEGADSLARIVFRHIEGRLDQAGQCQNAGHIALAQQNQGEALRRYTEALQLHLSVQDHQGASSDFGYLGRVANRAGLPQRAVLFFESALDLHRRVGDQWGALLDLQSQAKAFLSHGPHAVAGLAALQRAAALGRRISPSSAARPKQLLQVLLARLAEEDLDESREVERLLREDAEVVRQQGVEALLADAVLAVSFHEDQLTVAQAFNDGKAACTALGLQALALARTGQYRAGAAALHEARKMAPMESPAGQELKTQLEAWQGMFRNILTESRSNELHWEVTHQAEPIRSQAVAHLAPFSFASK